MAHFKPGTQILWRYELDIRPVTVVRDDSDGLVAWLAPGTPTVRSVTADGGNIRDIPLERRFRVPHTAARGRWLSPGTLKIAPAGVPWSVWVFWDDDWNHTDWYVNLEDVHRRDDVGIITHDHVLDVVVRPDYTTMRKDEDELAAAVEAGRFTTQQAAQFEEDARLVEMLVAQRGAPFSDGWEDWRPDPSWPRPELPVHIATGIKTIR